MFCLENEHIFLIFIENKGEFTTIDFYKNIYIYRFQWEG
jgi:hypothetical protein